MGADKEILVKNLPKYYGKCHYVVKGKLNVSFVLVICKMPLIWSHP